MSPSCWRARAAVPWTPVFPSPSVISRSRRLGPSAARAGRPTRTRPKDAGDPEHRRARSARGQEAAAAVTREGGVGIPRRCADLDASGTTQKHPLPRRNRHAPDPGPRPPASLTPRRPPRLTRRRPARGPALVAAWREALRPFPAAAVCRAVRAVVWLVPRDPHVGRLVWSRAAQPATGSRLRLVREVAAGAVGAGRMTDAGEAARSGLLHERLLDHAAAGLQLAHQAA
jgi:hypothetical protein